MRKHKEKKERPFGYDDPRLVPQGMKKPGALTVILAIIIILGVWFALDQKLLLGSSWISETYDNPDWRTNEGNLRTYGAWDIETHIWKTEYIMEHFPNFHWNPYWYLGMPLIKYYPIGFYALNAGVISLTGMDAARSTMLLAVYGHLLAALLVFYLGYKVSKRVWPSALAAIFLLASTFISLRSYGWEPITVVFLALYPIGLLVFLKDPLRPLRLGMILTLALAYLSHPLIWLSLCLTMGVYLLSIALRKGDDPRGTSTIYLWQLFGLVGLSLLIGAVQFLPQITYEQATSGAHMGVTYLPFYQVPFNIIKVQDFFFDAGNLKGPGPIIAIAAFFAILFAVDAHRRRKRAGAHKSPREKDLFNHELVLGLLLTLIVMVVFYYFERYRIFPMNLLQSTQYHRIIPEMIMLSAIFLASAANLVRTHRQKVVYYAVLISFAVVSMFVVYNVQTYWATSPSISSSPEFISEDLDGRITFPYTDQSLSVRNSFTETPQLYGYYEQGITNPYADEGFSVSSGFHGEDLTLLYLRSMNVGRVYVNTEEGKRDVSIRGVLNGSRNLTPFNDRYSYFTLELPDPSAAQAVDLSGARAVNELAPGCRVMFQEEYCGSAREEFVRRDLDEIAYLRAYLGLLEQQEGAQARMSMIDPDHYRIRVRNASEDTAVVVKMTYDKDFRAWVGGQEKEIETIGPYFMLIAPQESGTYDIMLEYTPRLVYAGALISVASLLVVLVVFAYRKRLRGRLRPSFKKGDM